MTEIKKQLQKIPSLPGVYFFKNAKREIIYIGKAVNLKARVKSYFSQKLYGLKAAMIPEIVKIDYKTTDTEIDALILESQYIKKHLPKYNVMLKDDKNYFYVAITGDKFPKIFITHQPQKVISSKSMPAGRQVKVKNKNQGFQKNFKLLTFNFLTVLGPYTDGTALKTTLRFLRKIFPYCTCKSQHKLPCLKAHLGLCLGICCAKTPNQPFSHQLGGDLTPPVSDKRSAPLRANSTSPLNDSKRVGLEFKKRYFANIKSIINILSGKKKSILAKLEREMKAAAKKENFEKAAEIRNKISALKNIFEHKIGNSNPFNSAQGTQELAKIFDGKIERIEFYDISNIQGQLATGSMVVFDGEKINKKEYRKFKIKTVHQSDDPAMMKEVLERRLKHTDWPMPDLIIVDGGITQLNAAREITTPRQRLHIASLAKNPDRLFISPFNVIALKDLSENTRLLLQNLRDEAHRFAIGYHRKLRSKKMKSEFR